LKEQIRQAELGWEMEFNQRPFTQVDPRRLGQFIEEARRGWRGEISRVQKELRMFADAAATRRWLKRERKRLMEDEFELPF
jgi:hypothetical protein